MKNRALFLDRDGVINVDHGYVIRREDFHFIDGIFELVRHAKSQGYLVVVVTNQAGIGRGYYTEEDFHQLMDWVAERFAENGGAIDKVYFCPDHPEHGIGQYRRQSSMRKPSPGMILAACEELSIDPKQSILVGDKISDVQAAQAAGIATTFLLASTDCNRTTQVDSTETHIISTLNQVIRSSRIAIN
ncbi:MAG TPA: D-glycero-beta-D-manno-heptose 1,7-bisphosphate 7-phosphatase [Eoetvoesiella sp.]|uniref:D-glycero-beta-D-manno-heptose 1,7-bisphosphate 7-phosphatase n=1 Tax=Eoetvoesiella sp. TaxID=1966355 RepID=UPI002C1B7F58|nr:D-glycero-beta-D-manno-heptose 1,7-bisphosphate 7-phosphatase [Eoetvoesiella sp.]HWK61407.1 D-glycero-beta-D-manno-heptose 1,7-bisphosphate 7-phosphatase [Eoetvoesiella sp.]